MAQENDIVLIYFEGKPLSFARIESILPDAKPDWYHVKLLLLQTPLQVATWILKDRYINGYEFTMNGRRIRLEKVVAPREPDQETETDAKSSDSQAPGGGKVISLSELRKR